MEFSAGFRELMRPRLLVQNIIWGALTMTILIYTGVAYLIINQQNAAIIPLPFNLRIVLYVAAVAIAAGSILLRQFLLSEERVAAICNEKVDAGSLAKDRETGNINEAQLNKLRSLPAIELKIIKLSERYFTVLVLNLALHEAIGLLGFIMAIQEHRFTDLLPFVAIAIILNILRFPKFNNFAAEVRAKFP